MLKPLSELMVNHYSVFKDGYSTTDYFYKYYQSELSKKCRSGHFKTAKKIKNKWHVDEDEFMERVGVAGGALYGTHTASVSSDINGDDIAKFVGGAIGVIVAIFLVIGFFKIVAGGSSSYSGGGSSYSGYSSQKAREDAIRDAAGRLYDNCQRYGSGYDSRCN